MLSEQRKPKPTTLDPLEGAAGGIPRLLTNKDLEAITGIPEPTWRFFRAQGRGPRAIKFSRNRTYYDPRDVREWLDAHRESEANQ